MIKWVKPSGAEIETNDLSVTIQKAESLGWEKKPKRGRKPKTEASDEQLNNDNSED